MKPESMFKSLSSTGVIICYFKPSLWQGIYHSYYIFNQESCELRQKKKVDTCHVDFRDSYLSLKWP